MLAGAERHARSDDPEPGPYPEPRDGERAVIHDAIPDGDLARRRSVMVGRAGAEAVAVVSRCVGESHVQITSRWETYHQTIWEDTQIRNTNV